jgi:hypothetical protein
MPYGKGTYGKTRGRPPTKGYEDHEDRPQQDYEDLERGNRN